MRLLLLFVLCASGLFAQKKPVTLDTLDAANRLSAVGPGSPVAWAPQGDKWIYRRDGRLFIYDANARSSRQLIDAGTLDKAAVAASNDPQPFGWENRRVIESNVQWSSNGNEVLYSSGDLFLIQVSDGKWSQLT